MRRIFADSMYWIALASIHDQWHPRALRVSQSLRTHEIVTTEEVLSEFVTYFSEHGPTIRRGTVHFAEGVQSDPRVVVHQQSHQSFVDGLALYKARPDKGYSLTDCISMEAMRREGITEVLTHDNHFAQEGFVVLL